MDEKEGYVYRQSFAISKEMKEVLDDYCRMNDIPKSIFIRQTVFREIASKGNKWKNLVDKL